jgi:AcrR family transcriptional regulator
MNALTDNDVYWWRPLDDAEPDTRERILFAAYKEFHVNGFQSASLSRILAHTGVTKGALYHHFPNKTALGYAVVDEVIARRIQINFIEPITQFEDPVEGFIEFVKHAGDTFSMTDIQLGCPLSVLAQEMAPIDEGFRTRLTAIYEKWRQAIDDVLTRAKRDGLIIESIDTGAMAATLLSIIEGSLSAAKVAQSLATLHLCGAGMIQVLQLIRTRPDANDG